LLACKLVAVHRSTVKSVGLEKNLPDDVEQAVASTPTVQRFLCSDPGARVVAASSCANQAAAAPLGAAGSHRVLSEVGCHAMMSAAQPTLRGCSTHKTWWMQHATWSPSQASVPASWSTSGPRPTASRDGLTRRPGLEHEMHILQPRASASKPRVGDVWFVPARLWPRQTPSSTVYGAGWLGHVLRFKPGSPPSVLFRCEGETSVAEMLVKAFVVDCTLTARSAGHG
jgi:hypothetical protein